MDIVEKLRGRSEYERHLGVELIYLYHMDVENICAKIEQLREALKFYADPLNYEHNMDAGELARSALQQKESK